MLLSAPGRKENKIKDDTSEAIEDSAKLEDDEVKFSWQNFAMQTLLEVIIVAGLSFWLAKMYSNRIS